MPRNNVDYIISKFSGMHVNQKIWVQNLAQLTFTFGAPAGNAISIPPNYTIHLVGNVDLLGSRLVAQGRLNIMGTGPYGSSLTSTGLSAGASLITGSSDLYFDKVGISAPSNCYQVNSTGAGNFIAYGSLFSTGMFGTIANFGNVVFSFCSFVFNDGITLTGTGLSVVVSDCSFQPSLLSTANINLYNLTISVRVRIMQSVIVVPVGGVGILYNTVTISPGSLILLNNYFSGSGVMVSGVTADALVTRFSDNVGILNSVSTGQFSMSNNVITTPLTQSTWTPILGTATAITTNRFSFADRTLTYLGILSDPFNIFSTFSLSSGNAQDIGVTFAINGVPQTSFSAHVTTNGNGKVASTCIVGKLPIVNGDQITVVVMNETSGTSVTIEHLLFLITQK